VCALLTDYDAVRMYSTDFVEELLGIEIGDQKPSPPIPALAYEEYFAEGGARSVRHLGKGSRIREKISKEDREMLNWAKSAPRR